MCTHTHTHSQAYLNAQMKGKKTAATVEAPKEAEIPRELLCSLCKELVRDAVIIPCCGESFCYGCIQEYLCENEFTCPACKTADVSPERLAPNKALRTVSVCIEESVCVCMRVCACMCVQWKWEVCGGLWEV